MRWGVCGYCTVGTLQEYWKEHCFGLTADLLVDKAIDLKFVGGTYSANVKPCPFMCLILKMLQASSPTTGEAVSPLTD